MVARFSHHPGRTRAWSGRLPASAPASLPPSTGLDPHAPMPIGTAQTISYHAQRTAGITHGHGIHTLRHCFATHRLEAGVDVRTIQMLLGHQALNTTTRSLRITRQHLATGRSPFDLLPCGDPPQPTPE